MSLITEPKIKTIKKGSLDAKTAKEGPELKCSYYRFVVETPLPIQLEELTSEEVLILADKAGTFDFLDAPEEDIYNPSDGTPI